MSRTLVLHAHNPQFLNAMTKPHKLVRSCSIARWLKAVSGVDVSCYSPHSMSGTSTSTAAAAGILMRFWGRQGDKMREDFKESIAGCEQGCNICMCSFTVREKLQ